MEKDKSRSVINVTALLCSILALASVLLTGCPSRKATTPSPAVAPIPRSYQAGVPIYTATADPRFPSTYTCTNSSCTHPDTSAAFSHHQHQMQLDQFAYTPAYGNLNGVPAPVKCPTDNLDCPPDSVKCLACGTRLW